MGIDAEMLTRDNAASTEVLARSAGAGEYEAQALPSERPAGVSDYKYGRRNVRLVGRGFNDAPTLAAA